MKWLPHAAGAAPEVARHFLPGRSLAVAWWARFVPRRGTSAGAAGASKLPPEAGRAELDEQHRHGERLAAVLESVDSAILALDTEHRCRFANAAAVRLFGAPEAHQGRVASLQRLPQLLHWMASVADSGTAWSSRLLLPDERTLQVHLTPLAPGGCVLVARDITATVHLETARRDFIAAISHELRTPLTSIQGYAEMLRQSPEPSAAARAEYAAVIEQNALRLTRLARDLVTLSSIETGTYPFHFAVVEAAALAAPALAVVEPLAREQGSPLVLGPMAAGRIRADADALHRVLLNLLENALLHGRGPLPDAPGIEVALSGEVAGSEYVYRVRDTGVGIGSADQPRVFERFYRVPGHVDQGGEGSSAASGTGLGLALVKHIVIEHGGRVELESALGQGSTFTVRLPLHTGEEEEGS